MAPDGRLDLGRRAVSSGTMTARSRSTVGWRDGAVDAVRRRLAAGQAGDRELGDDDPLGAQVERGDDVRMELAEPADEAATGGDPGGAAGMEVRIVGDRRRRPAWRAPSRRQSSSRTPFASSRSYGRAGRSQAAGSAAPVSANPSRHHSRVGPLVRGAVALADLEDRDVVAAVAQVGRDDLEEAAERGSGAGPSAGSTAGS